MQRHRRSEGLYFLSMCILYMGVEGTGIADLTEVRLEKTMGCYRSSSAKCENHF